MAKKNESQNVETQGEPYIHEETKSNTSPKNKIAALVKTRGAKVAAIAAGSALAVGAAFGIGFSAGNVAHPDFGHQQFGQGDHGFGDRDGDHRGPHDGKRPPVGGQQSFGDRDGDGPHDGPHDQGSQNGGQLPAPDSSAGTATTTP